jgi:U3 small nucleolar RNA-associated protein 10
LKFLHPYVEALTPPPKHVIVYAATNNLTFFTGWNNYVLKSCQQRNYAPAMLSYWAATVSEAIAAQLDQTISGSAKAQRQKEEDIILRILPVLSKGMAIKQISDIRVGCYMILSVLVSKANIDDLMLKTMMEAVAAGATDETFHAALICLSVIAQRRDATEIPPRVFKFIMANSMLVDDLIILSERYLVGNLVNSLIMEIILHIKNGIEDRNKKFIYKAFDRRLLNDVQTESIIKTIVNLTRDSSPTNATSNVALELLKGSLSYMKSDSNMKFLRQMQAEDTHPEIRSILQHTLAMEEVDQPMLEIEDTGMGEQDEVKVASWRELVTQDTKSEASYLVSSVDGAFERLASAFSIVVKAQDDLNAFKSFSALDKANATTKPTYITFFIRYWCSSFPINARLSAIDCVTEVLENVKDSSIAQALIPYILVALRDKSNVIRKAAIKLVLTLKDSLDHTQNRNDISFKNEILYSDRHRLIKQLPTQDLQVFVSLVIIQNLEECKLDRYHIDRSLRDVLAGNTQDASLTTQTKALKGSSRAGILQFLASHAIATSISSFKLSIVEMTKGLEKAGSVTRTETLLPLLLEHAANLQERSNDTDLACTREFIEIVSPSDKQGNETLQQLLESEAPYALYSSVFQYVQTSWPLFKRDIRFSWSDLLFKFGLLDSSGSTFNTAALETLRSVQVPSNALLNFLDLVPRLDLESLDLSSSAKRRKLDDGNTSQDHSSPHELLARLRKITIVLELIGSTKETDPRLLPNLFRLLQDLQNCSSTMENDLTYTHWHLLTCIQSIIEHAKNSGSLQIDHSIIRVDLIVECLTHTSDPQTQHAALLLLSSLADLEPELIIHSMMPVFTFMGKGILRQSDEYSAHVVDQTIESIVPPLIASFRKQKGGAIAGASGLISSFVAAFERLVPHRRLELFTALINKLGPDEYLFVLFVILQDRFRNQKFVTDFMHSMLAQYPALTQFRTIQKCLDTFVDSISSRPKVSNQIFVPSDNQDKDSHLLQLSELPSALLTTPRLSARVAKALRLNNEDALEIRLLYSQMIQYLLQLSTEIQLPKKLLASCQTLLNTLIDFFSMPESLKSLDTLLQQGNEHLRRQVLTAFGNRVEKAMPGDVASQDACFQLLPTLVSIVEQSKDTVLKQIAVGCIDRIVEKFGKKDVDRTLAAAAVIAGKTCLQSEDLEVQAMSLLALTTMVEVLRDVLLPVLPTVLSTSYECLKAAITGGNTNTKLHNAVYSLFSALLLYLPWIITGRDLDQCLEISYRSASLDLGLDCDQIRVEALELVAKQIDAHECFAGLERNWSKAIDDGLDAVKEHLNILNKAIERHSKPTIAKEAQLLVSSFLSIMGLRATVASETDKWEDDEIMEIEDIANEIMIKTIYKLNDTHFRPLFIKMSESAVEAQGKNKAVTRILKQSSWFSFLLKFFDTLQVKLKL